VVLAPKAAEGSEGMNMLTGVQEGHFAPTNKENAIRAKKMNYCTHETERVKRPIFTPKIKQKANPDGTPPPAPSEKGGPSAKAKSAIPDIRVARPKDFFDLQITPEFVEKVMVNCTNQHAASEGAGAGGTTYIDWVPFDIPEMYKFIGLMFVNGLSPKPSMDLWFLSTAENRMFGNNYVSKLMDKNLGQGKGQVKGFRRWKHFWRFLALYDFRATPKQEAEKNPLWKVQSLLHELNNQAQKMWTTGRCVSIDEQTLGFKGKHGMKLRISYKREGDGFQCDAICESGYTFAFWFRHGDAPVLSKEFKHLDLSPTARRVVWLAQQLPNAWTEIYMDNLFNSRKLFTALYLAKALAHGVVRTNGRGVPPSVIQTEEKNKKEQSHFVGDYKNSKIVQFS